MSKYTDADEIFIAKNCMNMTDKAIGLAIGKPVSGIKRKRARLGFNKFFLSTGTFKRRVPISVMAKCYEMHKEGITFNEIATSLSTTRQSVSRWVKNINGWSGGGFEIINLKSKI